MSLAKFTFCLSLLASCFLSATKCDDGCPSSVPINIKGTCYRFETAQLSSLKDAKSNCRNLEAELVNIRDTKVLEEIHGRVGKFISDKVEKAYFWIGLTMEDTSISKAIGDRDWTYHFDKSTVVQKDYPLWKNEPSDRGLACSVIDGANDFKTMAVDCGGPRVPVICMKKDEPCQDSTKPYFWYADYCLASINGALEYKYIGGACHPDTPTPVKDERMLKWVILAAKNSFLGGAIFQDLIKTSEGFFYMDGSQPPEDMWEEGEPRGDYDCVGLSWQMDNSLKLKTLSCDFMASYVCSTYSSAR